MRGSARLKDAECGRRKHGLRIWKLRTYLMRPLEPFWEFIHI